jgi:hypothetical protein
MIKERTFIPVSEKFQHAIEMANEWMAQEGVTPISIETINRITGGDNRAVESHPAGVRIWYISKV